MSYIVRIKHDIPRQSHGFDAAGLRRTFFKGRDYTVDDDLAAVCAEQRMDEAVAGSPLIFDVVPAAVALAKDDGEFSPDRGKRRIEAIIAAAMTQKVASGMTRVQATGAITEITDPIGEEARRMLGRGIDYPEIDAWFAEKIAAALGVPLPPP